MTPTRPTYLNADTIWRLSLPNSSLDSMTRRVCDLLSDQRLGIEQQQHDTLRTSAQGEHRSELLASTRIDHQALPFTVASQLVSIRQASVFVEAGVAQDPA